ncbi:hypothetical protein [Thermus amyloliquefaciens]|uniref:hypothetical protein n=1 Tax=Thermus amyloliquefaciens TaxID=1449080 RepID=UPI00056DD677|nr:hypothetical protein [Thermus amyloliquefaciens]
MRKAIILLFAHLPLSLAQVNLTLSPARVELSLAPGEAFTLPVTLRNGLPREEPLTVRLSPFRVREDGGVEELTTGDELCRALQVRPSAFTVPGGGEVQVLLEGKAPAGEGTLACLVVFTAQPRAGGQGGVRLSLRPEIGLAVYVTLRGTERPSLRAGLGGEGKALPVVLENPGNVLQRVSGEVLVLDGEGKEVARLFLEEVPIWPGGGRRLFLEPESPLPPGRYRVVLVLQSAYGRYATEGVWVVP